MRTIQEELDLVLWRAQAEAENAIERLYDRIGKIEPSTAQLAAMRAERARALRDLRGLALRQDVTAAYTQDPRWTREATA